MKNFLLRNRGHAIAGAVAVACLAFAAWQHSRVASGNYTAGVEVNGVPLAELLPLLAAAATGVGAVVTGIVRSVRGPTLKSSTSDEIFAELASRAWSSGGLKTLESLAALKGDFK